MASRKKMDEVQAGEGAEENEQMTGDVAQAAGDAVQDAVAVESAQRKMASKPRFGEIRRDREFPKPPQTMQTVLAELAVGDTVPVFGAAPQSISKVANRITAATGKVFKVGPYTDPESDEVGLLVMCERQDELAPSAPAPAAAMQAQVDPAAGDED